MPAKIEARPNNKYMLRVDVGADELGRRRIRSKSITAKNIRDAEKEYALFYTECMRTAHISDQKPTLNKFYEYYWEHYVLANSLELGTQNNIKESYKRIKQSLGHLRIDKINVVKCNEFLKQLREETYTTKSGGVKNYAPATIRKKVSLLKSLLHYAYIWEFIADDVASKIKLPKLGSTQKKTIASQNDLRKFFECLAEHKILKHRLWVLLAFALGLRREEIFGLQWQDINDNHILIQRAVVHVNGHGLVIKDTKTQNSTRLLTMPLDLKNTLHAYKISDEHKFSHWIFPNAKDPTKPSNPTAFKCFLRRFAEKHGVYINPHEFRHLSGSYKLSAGADIASVSADLGHSDKSFTMKTYIHEIQSAQEQNALLMNNILTNLHKKQG